IFVIVAKGVESHLTVDEARIGLIKLGMDTEVSVPAYPDKVFKGKVGTIAPLGDARAHTFDVTVFAEDPQNQLKPGMFAQVNVVAATKPNAILVPTASIVQQGTNSRVFVVANGKASAKTVKTGIADATSTEITEGVAAGDQVVTVGQNVLRDGQAVAVATPGAGGSRSGGGAASATPGGASGATGSAGTPKATGSGTPGTRPSSTPTP
ncbi:MAG: efflux RND transporter periplasmic adaptor subunit, partial [Dehalococcoidia bacterium]